MALTPPPALRSDARADQPLPGFALQVMCGLAWLGVAWSFSFLDRSRGGFGFFAAAWAVVGLLGFGLAVLHRHHPEPARRSARALTIVACILTLVPGYFMFVLVRWAAFGLLLVTAARAPAMRTRRDFYYAIAAVMAVSLLVLTHDAARWTIWFYLAPAWACMALALAWDYAAGVRLPAHTKAGFSAGFLAACIALAIAITTMLPLPRTQGFGFLEPGTDNPGRFPQPAGAAGGQQGRASGPDGNRPGGASGDAQQGTGGASSGQGRLLGDALQGLYDALRDPALPGWQRGAVAGVLAVAEALARQLPGEGQVVMRALTAREMQEMRERAAALRAALDTLLQLLVLLLLALLRWRARWRVAGALLHAGAVVLAPWAPGPSLRCAMWALRCALHRRGHVARAGESLLESVQSARFLPPPVHAWLCAAVYTYGGWRFGGARVTPAQASAVRRTVSVAEEAMRPGRTSWPGTRTRNS